MTQQLRISLVVVLVNLRQFIAPVALQLTQSWLMSIAMEQQPPAERMKFFTHLGANFYRCNLGVGLIFDPDEREYALTLFAGPFLFMCGWEPT